jgi:hypothetical protein
MDNTICIKKMIRIVFMRDFWKHNFFSFGECFPTHYALCHFVSGLHSKHYDCSPVMDFLEFQSSVVERRYWHDAVHSCFCSIINAGGKNLAHIFLCPKFYSTIMCMVSLPMFKDSALIQRELPQLSVSRTWTASIFSSVSASGSVTTSGITFHILPAFTERGVPSVNVERTEPTAAICFLNHLQCF